MIEHAKTAIAIAGGILGLAGTVFTVGANIGRSGEVIMLKAQMDLHSARIQDLKEETLLTRHSADAALDEARSTRLQVEHLLEKLGHAH